jgi:phage portal protein BeeE
MNPFSIFKRQREKSIKVSEEKNKNSFDEFLGAGEDFGIFNKSELAGDPYLLHAWVNIAVNILIRNIARADFSVKKGGEDIGQGQLFDLFHSPNPKLSRYDLWKETAAWWFLEGEAFWWFGADYSGGLPKEIYILDPRKMQHEGAYSGGFDFGFRSAPRRWFYHSEAELIPILSDEIIHFREWNPWNPVRGVNPLVSLALELEQDYYANKANSTLLKTMQFHRGYSKLNNRLGRKKQTN